MLDIIDGGVSTTVQDLGRFGQYHIGMPPSGAMDSYAHTNARRKPTTSVVGASRQHLTRATPEWLSTPHGLPRFIY